MLAYLWGIETRKNRGIVGQLAKMLAYLWGIETISAFVQLKSQSAMLAYLWELKHPEIRAEIVDNK